METRRREKDQSCVRISTQRFSLDTQDNSGNNSDSFGRYLPTVMANTYIRTALLNAPTTEGAQVAGIGTTKTGYVIRFKNPESAKSRSASVVLSGDFNRHHPTWGGNHIQPRFVEDTSELIDFSQAHGLHNCLS